MDKSSKDQNRLTQVLETDYDGLCFEVKHKILHIPQQLYLNTVRQYNDPYSESAAQHFTSTYLSWKDDKGIVGMVRINLCEDAKKPQVVLEAAVRYVVDCENSGNSENS